MSIFSNLFKRIPFVSLQSNAGAAFHTISSSVTTTTLSGNAPGGVLSSIFYRTNVRCYFPKPKEVKRIKVHGWNKRMSTPEGRRILMRRILKGRHVLSH